MKTLIRGGRLLEPDTETDAKVDLRIADGFVVEASADFTPDEVIDAAGLWVFPGLVDLRARTREPGHEHKATIESETRAAVASGITTLCCPPDTDPVIDSPAVAQMIQARAWQMGLAFIHPLGALTRGLKGEQLADLAALDEAGCVGFSNALAPIVNTDVLRRAFEYAAGLGLTVFLHPEDPYLKGRGVVHEGAWGSRLGLPGIPETAETVAIARDLLLIEQTGVRAHFCHVSSARGCEMIARAQRNGVPVTADVAAHALWLCDQDLGFFDTQCHVRPPLRTPSDRDALRRSVAAGVIGAICSDHEPHEPDAKLAPVSASEAGISGLETLLALTLRLVDENVLDLLSAIQSVTTRPAAILGLDAGRLSPGATADVVLLDPGKTWRLQAETLVSRGRNSPFIGWEFKGRVERTLVGGETVFLREHTS